MATVVENVLAVVEKIIITRILNGFYWISIIVILFVIWYHTKDNTRMYYNLKSRVTNYLNVNNKLMIISSYCLEKKNNNKIKFKN